MANEFNNNYDYAVWYEAARQLLNKRVRITAAQSPYKNQYGWINDVISPDQGKNFNRILVQPEADPNVLIELGTGDYNLV